MKAIKQKIYQYIRIISLLPIVALRRIYYFLKRFKLKNKNPTIIASDCFGTFIYHNMGLRFNSPTINLYIKKNDFLEFVSNLKEYLSCDITEVTDKTVSFPVGKLEVRGNSVEIYFMHYKSFEEAKRKWNERKERVSFDNIYIIQLIQNATEEDICKFDKLQYKNKMLITSENLTNSPNVVEHDMLKKPNYKDGEILFYENSHSIQRPMDKLITFHF